MTNIARRLARKLISGPHPEPPSEKPDPKEYSTLINPAEVPIQREAYYLGLNKYVREGDRVLDVGMGLGYGLTIEAIRAKEVWGVDVDKKSVDYCQEFLMGRNPRLKGVLHYDGYHLPFGDKEFDVIVSVDVLEHVERYDEFLQELSRVAKRHILISTPNRRAENTNSDGTPKNYWHLREWSPAELREILDKNGFKYDFYFLNGPADGPYKVSKAFSRSSQALTPVINLK